MLTRTMAMQTLATSAICSLLVASYPIPAPSTNCSFQPPSCDGLLSTNIRRDHIATISPNAAPFLHSFTWPPAVGHMGGSVNAGGFAPTSVPSNSLYSTITPLTGAGAVAGSFPTLAPTSSPPTLAPTSSPPTLSNALNSIVPGAAPTSISPNTSNDQSSSSHSLNGVIIGSVVLLTIGVAIGIALRTNATSGSTRKQEKRDRSSVTNYLQSVAAEENETICLPTQAWYEQPVSFSRPIPKHCDDHGEDDNVYGIGTYAGSFEADYDSNLYDLAGSKLIESDIGYETTEHDYDFAENDGYLYDVAMVPTENENYAPMYDVASSSVRNDYELAGRRN